MNKQQAIETIFTDYTDALGRVTLYPAKLSNNITGDPRWDSDNCFLWTGRFTNLFTWLKHFEDINETVLHQQYMRATVLRSIVECAPNKQLSRHIPNHEYLWSKIWDRVSLDEYIGTSLMILNCNTDEADKVGKGLYEGLKKNNWSMSFDSHFRYMIGKKFFKRVKDMFLTLKAMVKVARSNGKWGGSTEMDKVIAKNGDLLKLTSIMLPKDRLFVKLAAEVKPSIIDWTHHYLNCIFSIRKKKLSGLMLTFDKLLYFQRLYIRERISNRVDRKLASHFNLTEVKKIRPNLKYWIHSKICNYFHKEMTKEFGENYMKVIATKYYSENPKHPVIELYDKLILGNVEALIDESADGYYKGIFE
jgi:hypothetical protein